MTRRDRRHTITEMRRSVLTSPWFPGVMAVLSFFLALSWVSIASDRGRVLDWLMVVTMSGLVALFAWQTREARRRRTRRRPE